MTARRTLAVVSAAALAPAVAGCGASVTTLDIPTPPSPPSTAAAVAPLPDTSGVVPPTVAGAPTTTAVAMGPGQATIVGTVLGPSGPVAGATVEADRIVGTGEATTDATTAADGSFTLAGVLGGVYRLRAWQAPTLALTSPQIFFLAGTATQEVSLQLTSYAGLDVTTSMAPADLDVGDDANVVVAVSSQVVGPDGVVRPTPASGQLVDIAGAGGWTALGSDPATTGPDGTVTVEFQCSTAGAGALVASVAGATPATVQTSTCAPAPTTTTTSTTVPSGLPTSTTSTTAGF